MLKDVISCGSAFCMSQDIHFVKHNNIIFPHWVPVVQKMDCTIHWINHYPELTNCTIQWIEIYLMDSAIHLLKNWGLKFNCLPKHSTVFSQIEQVGIIMKRFIQRGNAL